ncbi:unnamed protein product [Closterium sp. NIES-53]
MARTLIFVALVLGVVALANGASVPFSYDKSGTDWTVILHTHHSAPLHMQSAAFSKFLTIKRRVRVGRAAVSDQHRDGRGGAGRIQGALPPQLLQGRLRRRPQQGLHHPWVPSRHLIAFLSIHFVILFFRLFLFLVATSRHCLTLRVRFPPVLPFRAEVVPAATESHLLHLSSGTYSLLQMHVHAMSEHTVNGLFAPMEAHFVHVHVDDPKKLAVVGVMLRLHRDDANSTWITQWLDRAPAANGANVTVPVSADFWTAMLAPSMGFWTYPGSLTTPECDEIVQWHVLRKSQSLSVAQTIQFMNMMAVTNNGERTDNRVPQPINGRIVYFYYPELVSQ